MSDLIGDVFTFICCKAFGEGGIGGIETTVTKFVGRVGKAGEELESFGVHEWSLLGTELDIKDGLLKVGVVEWIYE